MSYLVIDTETNGLFNFKLPADAPGQPRLAHLAMIRLEDDGRESDRTDIFVRPDGWTMPQGPGTAGDFNGLTDAFLHANGTDITFALRTYADEIIAGRVIVAFNAQYDCKVMRGEFRRAGMPDLFEQTRNICVMRPMTAVCRIPNRNRPGFKFPNLTEALAHFGHVREGDHLAVSDAEGAAIVFRELMARGLLPEPAVHFAKEKPEPKPPAARRRRRPTPADFGGLF